MMTKNKRSILYKRELSGGERVQRMTAVFLSLSLSRVLFTARSYPGTAHSARRLRTYTSVNPRGGRVSRVDATMIDIGANLLDPMYRGIYHGREAAYHPDDLEDVMDRAWAAGTCD